MNPWTVPIGHLNDLLADAPKEEENEKCTLEELDIPKEVILALGRMDIFHPSTIQRLSIKKALQKRNLIVQAKNGTGKSMSICIIVASRIVAKVKRRHLKKADGNVVEGGETGQSMLQPNGTDPPVSLFLHSIILVPTRELCVQLCDNIKEISHQGIFISRKNGKIPQACENVSTSSPNAVLGDHHYESNSNEQMVKESPFEVKPMVLYGGTDVVENLRMIFSYLPHVIISTPGRLKHVLSILKRLHVRVGQTETEGCSTQVPLTKIANVLIKQLILDEVDALLDEQFQEQIKLILSQVVSPKVQVLCYSSTFLESTITSFLKMLHLQDVGYLSRWKGFCVKRIDQVLGESYVGSIAPGEVRPEVKVRHTPDQETPQQSNESDEREVAAEVAPLEEYHKNEVSSPPGMPQNNRIHTKMVQTQSVFQEERSIRYILQKIVKEKRNVVMCVRRKREFEFVQTCTSVIIHGEGAAGRKQSHGAVKQFAGEERDEPCNPCDGTEGSNGDNHSGDVLGSPILRNVRHCFITVNNEGMNKHEELKYKMKVILKVVKEIKFHQCFLFINNTYEGVQVSKMLNKHDVSCYYTSSKVDHHERMNVFNRLKKNEVKVVVCSDVMSRGIDNIVCDLVINLDIPQNKETYIHRSGRCGRYGNRGLCISLCNYSDYNYLHYYKYQLRLPVHDFCYLRREQQFEKGANQLEGANQLVEGANDAPWGSSYGLRGREEEGVEAIRENATQEEATWEEATRGEHSASCVEPKLGIQIVEKKVPLELCRLKRAPRRKVLSLNIKGFFAEGIHIVGRGIQTKNQSDGPLHDVHLKVRVKKFLSKFKIVKNEVSCQFCLPNDNVNVFKTISIVQHESNLIIFFLFKRRIRMRFLSFRSVALPQGEEEKGSKWSRSNYCFLFFCNSDSYLVLKVFYFFLFLFKHYQYPLREALTPLLIHTGGITQKGGKCKNKCEKCCHILHPNEVNLNYVSDTCLMISNNVQRGEKKKKKNFKAYESDEDFYMNRQGKKITTFQKAMFYPFLLGSRKGHRSSGKLNSPDPVHAEEVHHEVYDETLQQREGDLQPSSMPLESALKQIKANCLERKKILTFSQQCSEVPCMNDQRKIAQKVNNLVAPQVFLNLATAEQDVHLLKGLFLQNHVQLHGGNSLDEEDYRAQKNKSGFAILEE
ncbi:RNA helicase [Plasmodium coatneyi]|uniref:RNA helicase n=1 Tax=Plasmodium coatneyi TaxID=208452 RepID=A0A1B1DSS4_9APIC|nr:RNA helicase [Plasmodium coatneyi]ANQ05841.1 RNA helicase [Plasmodium coatneyi]